MQRINVHAIFITLLLLFTGNFCWAANTSADTIGIVKTAKTFVDKQAYSTIKVTYPIIKKTDYTDELNKQIQLVVDEVIKTFKKDMSENQPLTPIAIPLTFESNSLDINYEVFSATSDVLSIRFSIYTSFYGSAHPFKTFQSFNYDLDKGKVLSLGDIFKSNNYLQFLSDYSKKELTKKLSAAASASTEPYLEGLKPIAKNFQIWNVTSKGLLLTFPPYQVAAYVFGPQEVVVPYSELQNLSISPTKYLSFSNHPN